MSSSKLYSPQQQADIKATIFEAFDKAILKRTERDALLNLLILMSQGNSTPTQRHIANKTRCSLRTVSNAIAIAKKLGFLTVTQLYRRVKWASRKTSCRYVFIALKQVVSFKRKNSTSLKTKEYKKKESEVIHRHKSVEWYRSFIQSCIEEAGKPEFAHE